MTSFFVQDVEQEKRQNRQQIQALADEKDQIAAEHQNFQKQKAKLELDVKDLQEELEGGQSNKVWPSDLLVT